MANAFQGFTIDNSLSESTLDRATLNNLGGSPLGDDISLFFNNRRNTSSLLVTSENITQDGEIVFPNTQSVFSNKTNIKIGEATYYVKNSNGIDRFQLSNDAQLVSTVTNPPIGEYLRSDEITLDNIKNFSSIRRTSNVNSNTSSNLNPSILDNLNTIGVLLSAEQNLDYYRFKETKSLKRSSNFLGTRVFAVGGAIIIKDPNNVNGAGLSGNSGPGLFIYNSATGTGVRAFSSTDNQWTANNTTNNLEVSSENIIIGSLNITTPVATLNSKSTLSPIVTPVSGVVSLDFTHSVEVLINGEIYNICLSL